jgi:hypothetical protein
MVLLKALEPQHAREAAQRAASDIRPSPYEDARHERRYPEREQDERRPRPEQRRFSVYHFCLWKDALDELATISGGC